MLIYNNNDNNVDNDNNNDIETEIENLDKKQVSYTYLKGKERFLLLFVNNREREGGGGRKKLGWLFRSLVLVYYYYIYYVPYRSSVNESPDGRRRTRALVLVLAWMVWFWYPMLFTSLWIYLHYTTLH